MTKSFTKYLFFFLVLCLIPVSIQAAWPEYKGTDDIQNINGTYYVLVHETEESGSIIWAKEYNLNGPAEIITFSATRQYGGLGNLKVATLENTQWQEPIFDSNPGGDEIKEKIGLIWVTTGYEFATYGPLPLDKNATRLKFYTETGATLKKYFKDVKVTMAEFLGNVSKTDINFGTFQIDKGTGCTRDTIIVDWCNISSIQMNGLEGTPFEAQILSVGAVRQPAEQYVTKGDWGSAKIQITFWHNVAGQHDATLTLTGGADSQSIQLHGQVSKLDQHIKWANQWESAQEHTIMVGMNIINAAEATSDLPVTYTLSDEDKQKGAIVISDDGTSFQAVKATTSPITIIAQQHGNEEFNPTQSTRQFIVSDKQQLFISWNQDLTHLSIYDDPIALSAKVMVVKDMNTGELAEDPIRTKLLQYTINYPTIATIQDNILHPTSIGNGVITATFAGDEQYEKASVMMPISVQNVAIGCEDQLILSDNQEITFFQMNTAEIIGTPIAIDHSNGIPGTLVFKHKREYWKFGIKYSKGTIKAQESSDNGSTWTDLPQSEITPEIGQYTQSPSIPISRNATHIRFVRPQGGEGYHFVTGIQIYPAQFIETEDKHDFGVIHVGSKNPYSFTIHYSNIKSDLLISASDSTAVHLSESSIKDDCGAWGEKSISLTFIPEMQQNDYSSTINITDAATNISTILTLYANISINTQTISWAPTKTTLHSTSDFERTATSSSKLPVSYKVTANSDVADFDNNGNLVIFRNGEVTITAYHPGNDSYSPAEQSVTFTVLLTPTFHSSGTSDDVHNWNNGRTPTTEDNVIIAADMHISRDLSIAGMTINQGITVTVKDGGHLTIGDNSSNDLTSYGNLVIENGGIVTLGNGTLHVKDLIINAATGTLQDEDAPLSENNDAVAASGQLIGQNIEYQNAYIDISFADYKKGNQWHTMTVPFLVDIHNGVFTTDYQPLTEGSDYLFIEYDGNVRATGKTGWKYIRSGELVPGTLYGLGGNGDIKTFRFKQTSGALFFNDTQTLTAYESASKENSGWNGVGNPTLCHGTTAFPVQVLNPTTYTFISYPAHAATFPVGAAFFIQTAENTQMQMQTNVPGKLIARTLASKIDNVCILFSNDNYSDKLYISASDEASDTYEVGKDLGKMSMTASPAVPQISAPLYSAGMCMVHLPLQNGEVMVPLTLYVPQSGQYMLSAQNNDNQVDVYLMQGNSPLWNLSAGDYNINLNKGNTQEYQILIRQKPQMPTGTQFVAEQPAMEKVLYQQRLYIIKDGAIYDSTGRLLH